MKNIRLKLMASVAAVVTMLSACGDGSSAGRALVAAGDTTLNVNGTIAGALAGTTFGFPSGVPEFGTTAATTLTFTSGGDTPAFSIASGGNTATGTTTFGSCIFRISNSSFPAGLPLANGQTVTVNPCTTNINTTGALANGVQTTRSVALLLGAAASANQPAIVSVSATGQLVLGGGRSIVASITLTPITGGTP
jgi:hypothetical protein